MKVTIEGVVFEGSPDEVYEVLNKLGYKINDSKNPITVPLPYQPNILPYYQPPTYIGDPPPFTYPNVWCGTGGSTMASFDDTIIGVVPPSDDLDKLSE